MGAVGHAPKSTDVQKRRMARKSGAHPGPSGRRIGYARVSTEDQSLALQLDALKAAGCDRIFHDHAFSGAAPNRPALEKALDYIETGDIFIVWKLDRLGRSLSDLIRILNGLREREIRFHSLSEAIETTTPLGRLFFHIMGALAEFERALISERTRAGMAAAKARGAAIGRPRKLSRAQIVRAREKIAHGAGTPNSIAKKLGVSPITLARAMRRSEEEP